MLYQNKRAVTLHLVSLLTLALSVFVLYMIFSDLDGFFIEYSSKASGIGWMIFMLLAGNVMLGCMFWLSGRYVLQISALENRQVIVKTWSFLGIYHTTAYPETILKTPKFHFGKANFSHVPTVNAPWWKLKTPNGKTLVVDMQGDFSINFKDYDQNLKPKKIEKKKPKTSL